MADMSVCNSFIIWEDTLSVAILVTFYILVLEGAQAQAFIWSSDITTQYK